MSTEPAKGPSKKELNKLARKEKKTAGPQAAAEGAVGEAQFTISLPRGVKAELARTVELYLGDSCPKIRYVLGTGNAPVLTQEVDGKEGSVSGDVNIARFLVRSCKPTASVINTTCPWSSKPISADSLTSYRGQQVGFCNPECRDKFASAVSAFDASLGGSGATGVKDAWEDAQIDQWLEAYSYALLSAAYFSTLLGTVDAHLITHTYLVGHSLTLADMAIYTLLKGKPATEATTRWMALVSAQLPAWTAPALTFIPKKTAAVVVEKVADEGGTCPPLENAVDGEVCTRFPPEPSGYLHIGHAKAVLLNAYYAERYHGKLLVRFDDTNPSKEKEEFEENILADLRTLGVKPDRVSHSSDYFAKAEEYARKMIQMGKAYMDDTEQEKMQAERLERVNSVHRDDPVAVNMEMFEKLLKGDKTAIKYCLRAKIDMTHLNGTMRDPVLYRYNATPHHRTGTTFCAYPTYDFVCPLLDSIEGVSHALRTTEYNDRDEQYHWIQAALSLRKTYIQSFGKMNFVNTVLSKRKLTWFVEQGLVEGWFDPRFPTVQGVVRRGVNVPALKSFILSQGASRRVITMEWDKFWAENKRVLEDSSARYMGVAAGEDVVELHLTTPEGVPQAEEYHSIPIHPLKPAMGTRVITYAPVVLIDQADASTLTAGEEVTLLRWGNILLTDVTVVDGKVKSMRGVTQPNAVDFTKTKKLTWLAKTEHMVKATLVEFDHLISKGKLADDEDFKDFVNPVTKTTSAALLDACLRTVSVGDVVQLERKGFYRVDRAFGSKGEEGGGMVLFYIPDGKTKAKK